MQSVCEPSNQASIDQANRAFWDELCGSGLAKHLGITDRTPASLEKYDRAYLDLYPYLLHRVDINEIRGKKVLEIGLGYGTLSQQLMNVAEDYSGLDIAAGPVSIVNERLRLSDRKGGAVQGSMLQCPFPDESFDAVVSVGCFHHTGDTQRCLDESFRVLRKGGHAYVMLYNRFSLRQWRSWPSKTFGELIRQYITGSPEVAKASEDQRRAYDASAAHGGGAPETQFFSRRQIRQMMSRYTRVDIYKENCDDLVVAGRFIRHRNQLLGTIGRRAGLDLYIQAQK
jgi:ubiquinone/menaquinone biosynthesis C-methylase UbiE